MEWLIIGVILGIAFREFVVWARANHVHIGILAWLLIGVALLAALSGVQNFIGLRSELEERAAWNVIPIYAFQTIVFAAPAALLIWRNARNARKAAP
jgi:hypothetical protein